MIHEGEILGGVYQVMEQIGHGGTGLVFKAWHRNLRKYVVIKRVQMGTGNLEALRAETDILKNLRHTNIPQVYDFLVRDGEVFTVMDFIEGKGLEDLIGAGRRMPEKDLVQMLLQLSATLDYLHRHRPPVIHSDIKPDNLIMTPDGRLCLIDFNIAVTTGVANSLSGYSLHFASPEQYRHILELRMRAGQITPLDARTDIFSTGAVFYYLMTGCYPDTRLPRAHKHNHGAAGGTGNTQPAHVLYQDMLRQGYSDALCSIIARCLEQNRHLRYSNGHRLYTAVRHLRRQDSRFRRYIALRAASWLLSAALIGSGCWYLVKGKRQEAVDAYEAELHAFTTAYNHREEEAQSIGNSLLNNREYAEIGEERPEDRIMILQCLGDTAAEKEDYENAQLYYDNALRTAQSIGRDTSRMYRDLAVAMAENGYLTMAQDVMQESGTDNADADYVQAYIYLLEGDRPACIQQVEQILTAGAEGALCADACVLAADACSEGAAVTDEDAGQDRLAWLERAAQYSGEARYQRILGQEYWKMVGDTRRTSQQWDSAAARTVQCYQRVTALPESGADDIVCLVTAMHYRGDYSGSISILLSAMDRYPADCRIPGYLALAYDGEGNRAEAARYASSALEMYEQGNPSAMDEDLLSRLKALKSM